MDKTITRSNGVTVAKKLIKMQLRKDKTVGAMVKKIPHIIEEVTDEIIANALAMDVAHHATSMANTFIDMVDRQCDL
jgi:hypothetical protein